MANGGFDRLFHQFRSPENSSGLFRVALACDVTRERIADGGINRLFNQFRNSPSAIRNLSREHSSDKQGGMATRWN
jgi:hypothetical protein